MQNAGLYLQSGYQCMLWKVGVELYLVAPRPGEVAAFRHLVDLRQRKVGNANFGYQTLLAQCNLRHVEGHKDSKGQIYSMCSDVMVAVIIASK